MSAINTTPAGAMRFYDNMLPPLESGDYRVTVTQTITVPHSDSYPYTAAQDFTVTGPRFALAEADVASVNPSPDSFADNSGTLPSIVLSQPTLPWQRNIDSENSASDTIPWMALLVFDDTETNPAPVVTSRPVADLLHSGDPAIACPDIALDLGDPTQCNTVDVDLTLFEAIVPTLQELPYLAHVRQVNVAASSAPGSTPGTFAVVIANRVPVAGGQSRACLVSLEGYSGVMSGDVAQDVTTVRLACLYSWQFGSAVASESFATVWARLSAQAANLALTFNPQPLDGDVLAFKADPPVVAAGGSVTLSWVVTAGLQCTLDAGDGSQAQDVTSATDAGGFGKVVVSPTEDATYKLAATPQGTSSPSSVATLHVVVDPSASQQFVADAFANGYVPLDHNTIEGESTVDWYRGPLSPIVTTRELLAPYAAASAAMIYDPTTGMFDQSYAVAWCIGRLVALADGQFPVELANWRAAGNQLVDLHAQRADLFTEYDQVLTRTTATAGPASPNATKELSLAATNAIAAHLIEAVSRSAIPRRAHPRISDGRLSGTLSREQIAALAAQGGDPTRRVIDRLLGKADR